MVLEEVHGGPEMVQKELDWYDTALCQYLKVSRTPLKVHVRLEEVLS